MAAAIRFRAAQIEDVSIMAELVARCNDIYKTWAPAGWSPPVDIAQREQEHLRQRLNDASADALVATKGDQIIAFVMWRPSRRATDVADLSLLFVDPAFWGIGIGRELLLAAERSMLQASFSQAELWVPLENARARRLYERNGWRESSQSREHSQLGIELQRYEKSL